ncbi:MAG TPA: hypothetical protein VMT46_01740 [Anaerolineaceae bacterium]|nr:hypothetical protein [Anaerolineaceae bacterium]
MPPGEFVEGGVQLARGKGLADLDLFAAVPPMCVAGFEDRLLGRGFGIRLLVGRFLLLSLA